MKLKTKKQAKLCPAKVGVRKGGFDPHTFPCLKAAGHDGAHEWKKDGETHLWYGPAHDSSVKGERFRFGKWLEAGKGW